MTESAAAPDDKSTAQSTPQVQSLKDILSSLVGKVVTMVNPESLENAPMGYQLTTGFYRAKVLAIHDDMVSVATELVHKGRETTKEPVRQFIPFERIKRISFAKSDVLVHI